MTVLDGHTSLIADVVPCLVKVEQPDGTEKRLAVHGGFLQVDTSPGAAEGLAEGDGPLPGMSTRVTVLAGVAEMAEEIDVPRAEQAKEAATQLVADLRAGRAPAGEARTATRIPTRPGRGGEGVGPGRAARRWPPAPSRRSRAAAGPEARSPAGGRRVGQSNWMELNSASLVKAWLASILRSVPDFERMTSDCVVAPNSWYCDAVEQLAVGDPRGGEEAVVALHQVVGGQHGVEVVPGLDGGRPLRLVARVEPPLDLPAHAFEGGGGQYAFGRAADAEEDVGAGARPARCDGPGHVTVGNEPDAGPGGAHLGDEVARGGRGRG